ncbi:protein HtrL-like [Babylonia areolata]|uniref:protein HtrL-like n=1 Tax=Babylonia areolata TaxID=304850 RepID=UPI003FD359B7
MVSGAVNMCSTLIQRCLGPSIQPWLQHASSSTKPRRLTKVLLLLLLLACVAAVLLVTCFVDREAQRMRKFTEDSYLAMSWEGFGPEKGVYNFTVVTAMLDIGRGHWAHSSQTRSYNTYLLYMQRVLRLDVNLVVFVDSQALPFVQWMRRGRAGHTHVVELTLKDLPYYSHRDRIQTIMGSEEYRRDNELVQKGLCESQVPEYDIVQWSKLYFLNETITRDPFHNELFVWLDGGYGHGEDIHPADGVWRPKNLFEFAEKVTLMEREPVEKYRPVADSLHKRSVNVVAGGFIAGGGKALQRLYRLQQELIARWMVEGIVDDDQTTYMQIYFQHPDLFRLVPADWDDVFRLFHSP